jgi:hypothetical protein
MKIIESKSSIVLGLLIILGTVSAMHNAGGLELA